MARTAQLKEWQANLLRNYKLFKRVLSTPDGAEMLKVLSEQFASYNLLGEDDRQTNFNLGQRSIVDYLLMMEETPDEVLERLSPKVTRGA